MFMHMCVCMYVDMCMYVYVHVKRLELFFRLLVLGGTVQEVFPVYVVLGGTVQEIYGMLSDCDLLLFHFLSRYRKIVAMVYL